MNRFVALLAVAALLGSSTGASAQDSAIAGSSTCTTAGLPAPVAKSVNGLTVWVRPLAVIADAAVTDFGSSSSGDNLAIYCVPPRIDAKFGRAAFCLTGEACPWK